MKAFVIGCGSIGERHISNLLELDFIDEVLVYTKAENCLDGFNADHRVRLVRTLRGNNVDFAIIANETAMHLETAMLLTREGVHLFIEKPLSHNLKGLEKFQDLAESKGTKVFIAYNLRFLGAIRFLKEKLTEGVLGDLYFSKIEAGQYLPTWRPTRDYSKSYSASKDKGGGVALDLSHEIDYMRYLFGDPCCWRVMKGKVSTLDIDSDDIFEGLFKYESGFICNVHLDYLQKEKKREIVIYGSDGSISCDLMNKEIRLHIEGENGQNLYGETCIGDEEMFNIENTYKDELSHFLDTLIQDRKPDITIEDGIRALRLLEDGNV